MMARTASGRSDEFAQLVSENQTRLFGYIYALVPNMADADDIYQDTVLALWRKFHEYRPNTNFAGWARTSARFEIQHHFRRKGRSHVCFDEGLLDELTETHSCLDSCNLDGNLDSYTEALTQCRDKLPENDRQMLDLCYGLWGGVTYAAKQLGRSPQSICNSLSRIRHVLFDCIQRLHQGGGQ